MVKLKWSKGRRFLSIVKRVGFGQDPDTGQQYLPKFIAEKDLKKGVIKVRWWRGR
tara:strand:- start:151 stop:315 length:165 start_codon:yes stop_codon:yes gene_type:complete